MVQDQSFKGRQFTAEVILWAVRWYLMFPISYRDLELMLLDRGVEVDHTTIFRWIQAYAAELEKRIRPHLRMSNGSWRVDETYVRVKGRWTYLYRAVDSRGQTIDFLLSAKRDAAAAKRFFRKALAQPHTVNPRTITVDKNPAYPKAATEMKKDGELWRRSRLRQVQIPEQHRRAGPPARETTDPARARLRQLLDGPTNTGRLRGDGDDQERAGSEHRRQRHQGPGHLHRRAVPAGRLNGAPPRPNHCPSLSLQQSHLSSMCVDGSRLGNVLIITEPNASSAIFSCQPEKDGQDTVDGDHGRVVQMANDRP